MYNNPYANLYNPQASIDRINTQIAELEKMKQQIPQQPIQQPTNLTQNFQIAPSSQSTMRYASSIDEVQKDMVIGDTPFFSRDMSVLWVKNTKGEIKSYELVEVIQKDEKDMMIESLQLQINELKKGMVKDAKSDSDDVDEPTQNKKSTSVSNSRTSKK